MPPISFPISLGARGAKIRPRATEPGMISAVSPTAHRAPRPRTQLPSSCHHRTTGSSPTSSRRRRDRRAPCRPSPTHIPGRPTPAEATRTDSERAPWQGNPEAALSRSGPPHSRWSGPADHGSPRPRSPPRCPSSQPSGTTPVRAPRPSTAGEPPSLQLARSRTATRHPRRGKTPTARPWPDSQHHDSLANTDRAVKAPPPGGLRPAVTAFPPGLLPTRRPTSARPNAPTERNGGGQKPSAALRTERNLSRGLRQLVGHLLCMRASREGSLIQATVGSFGGDGCLRRNRSGLAV